MAKDILSGSDAFFDDDVKIAYFTSLSDRLCVMIMTQRYLFLSEVLLIKLSEF